jgi:hypothetical protein
MWLRHQVAVLLKLPKLSSGSPQHPLKLRIKLGRGHPTRGEKKVRVGYIDVEIGRVLPATAAVNVA